MLYDTIRYDARCWPGLQWADRGGNESIARPRRTAGPGEASPVEPHHRWPIYGRRGTADDLHVASPTPRRRRRRRSAVSVYYFSGAAAIRRDCGGRERPAYSVIIRWDGGPVGRRVGGGNVASASRNDRKTARRPRTTDRRSIEYFAAPGRAGPGRTRRGRRCPLSLRSLAPSLLRRPIPPSGPTTAANVTADWDLAAVFVART